MTSKSATSNLEFLAGGGQMGALIRSHDWSQNPLGPPEFWPQSLRTALSIVLNSKLLGAVLWGPELRVLYNDVYMETLAERHPGALGEPVAEVWGATYALLDAPFSAVMSTGEGFGQGVIELPMRRDGRLIATYWSATASPIRGEDGSVVGLVNIALENTDQVAAGNLRDARQRRLDGENAQLTQDMAERVQERDSALESKQAAIQNAERVQLALAAGAIIGTWSWDLPNDSFTVDDAFSENFGFAEGVRRTGLTLAEVVENVHPDDRPGLAAAMNEAMARGGPYAHQYRVRRRDGIYYWLEANGRVELDKQGTAVRFPGVLIDVTERHALVEERDRAFRALRDLNEQLEQRVIERTQRLEEAEDALRQSHKMEAIGQLTGGLAHDFNNLLGGVTGALDLISLRIDQGRLDDLERYVATANKAVARAAALTHRLLAFARQQTLLPKPTNVNRLIVDMLDMVQRTVGPSIRVENVSAAGLGNALVDPSQLENALLNLCINARDAMPQGGRITIETGSRAVDLEASGQLALPEGDYLTVCVTDTGTGMSPSTLTKACDPFFTTKPLGQGTGLGLSMIYGFAKQSGGQVKITSELGKGSTICIYLPKHKLLEEAEPEDSTAANPTLPLSQGGGTVMIVDDEPSLRLFFAEVLTEMGYQVLEADNSAEGLKILQSPVEIDLLISDVGLPGGMNGRQMADASRHTRPDLKVLFVTGFAETALFEGQALDSRMQVLAKPFGIGTLMSRVKEMLSPAAPDVQHG